jgi:hypothetical protein
MSTPDIDYNEYDWPIAPETGWTGPSFKRCDASNGPAEGEYIATYELAVQYENLIIP